jgi:hypothetical protein
MSMKLKSSFVHGELRSGCCLRGKHCTHRRFSLVPYREAKKDGSVME